MKVHALQFSDIIPEVVQFGSPLIRVPSSSLPSLSTHQQNPVDP